jgi:hypothetical protein
MSCDLRIPLKTHPDAISFLRILQERVFQQPLAISLIETRKGEVKAQSCDIA